MIYNIFPWTVSRIVFLCSCVPNPTHDPPLLAVVHRAAPGLPCAALEVIAGAVVATTGLVVATPGADEPCRSFSFFEMTQAAHSGICKGCTAGEDPDPFSRVQSKVDTAG
jgi:hypothetical protein